MFDKISTALFNLIKSNAKVQSAYEFEASNLEGFPALTLTPSGNENDYSTTTENRRVYSFVVRLYVQRGSTGTDESQSENTMRELVDTVLDTIDKNHSAISIDSQTGYTFLFMQATPSQWGYAGRENEMRVAEVKISLQFDIDTTLIT